MYAKHALANLGADRHYMHASKLLGWVRIYTSLEGLVADCDFKDAENVLFRGQEIPETIGVAEDTQSGLWYILANVGDLIPSLALEHIVGGKRAKT